MNRQKELDFILDSGFGIKDEYSLVNNYGYKILFNGQEYDLRHWLNVYGVEVNYWDISPKCKASEEDRKILEEFEKKMTEEFK